MAGALAGCATTTIPLTGIEVPVPDIPFPRIPLLSWGREGDYHAKSWTKAFELMHQQISQTYPCTEWKGIDWQALADDYGAKVAAAETAEDQEAYYLALRGYLYSLGDGNVSVVDDEASMKKAIGGGFGFALLEISEGQTLAYQIVKGGPAEAVGMEWGAEIVAWNEQPVAEAIAQTPVLWADKPPATAEGRRLEQGRLLTRAPVGTTAQVTFKNPGSETPWVTTITAVDDGYETLSRTGTVDLSEFESPIHAKELAGGYGYIKVLFQAPTLMTPFPTRVFRKAMRRFESGGAPGLVIDLRGNTGGAADLVPKFAGHFFQDTAFFQDMAYFDEKSGVITVNPEERLTVEPVQPYYEKPVAVLVDEQTLDTGEAFALLLQRLSRVQVLGFHATQGSLGNVGGDVFMPEGYTLSYPVGRSQDESGKILVQGNMDGVGGVEPDVRVPLTAETVRALYVDGADVLLDKAVELLGAAQAETGDEDSPGAS